MPCYDVHHVQSTDERRGLAARKCDVPHDILWLGGDRAVCKLYQARLAIEVGERIEQVQMPPEDRFGSHGPEAIFHCPQAFHQDQDFGCRGMGSGERVTVNGGPGHEGILTRTE
ncbi:hypothetical protein [Falsirhodobacter sp. 20TX0035]|uniref:hypothetical protein n=1 Tax=Falsirhodobacter sp. 20TX0035 TaxID=3022019 RepID=UPI00232DB5CF|nr:hypothetical protein [Falsirhodobacter sp. 20TX0035]MDB6454937.1 hypothetical protein [Falsirhodobacter sp. 20TX0035]